MRIANSIKSALLAASVLSLLGSTGVLAQDQAVQAPPGAVMSVEVGEFGGPAPDDAAFAELDIVSLGPEAASEDILLAAAPGLPSRGLIAHRGSFGGRSGGGMFGGLSLTDEQYEKLFALKRDAAGKSSGKIGELVALEMGLCDLMLQPELDRTKILATQAKINTLKADIANTRLENKIATMAVLTAEQRGDLRRAMLRRIGGGARRGFGCPVGSHKGQGCPVSRGECPMPKK